MSRKELIASAVTALLLAGSVAVGAAEAGAAAKEKCYGVAKAGKNDCAANGHACQGQARSDGNAKEWIYVPAGTCVRLVGGKLTAG